jgi:hypothetical protein
MLPFWSLSVIKFDRMGELIGGRFPEKRRNEGSEEIPKLAEKRAEMRAFFSDLKKTDTKAEYHPKHVALRRSIIEQVQDDKELEKKFLSGNKITWKGDPQWWYALEEVLEARHRFLNEQWST